MKCVIDGTTELESGQVCHRCELREAQRLADIVRMHAQLGAFLEPGTTAVQRVSGSREAPLPLRVDALDLAAPARVVAIRGYFDDQMGEISVATVLDSWVRDWIDVRDRGENLPVPVVARLGNWLSMRLDWACMDHPAIDEYSDEIGSLWYALRRTTGDMPPKPEPCGGVPCKRCDLRALYRENDGSGDVRCGSCRHVITGEEYHQWTRLVGANAKEIAA